jgi:hypothetical protein
MDMNGLGINTSLPLNTSVIRPDINNVRDIGTSSLKYKDIHATTVNSTTVNSTTANATTANATTVNATTVNATTVDTGLLDCNTLKLNSNKIAIGLNSGITGQGINTVAIGSGAGETSQGDNSIAIGNYTGAGTQQPNSIAIGTSAGKNRQGFNAIAIGNSAGFSNQGDYSTVINASSAIVNGTTPYALYMAPIRKELSQAKSLNYDPSSKEVTYTNTGNYIQVESSTDAILENDFVVRVSGMFIAPPAGNYMATFSCYLENDEGNSDDGIECGIYLNNNLITHTLRRTFTGEQGKYETTLHTQAVVTIIQGDNITIQAEKLTAGSVKISNRSLIMISLGNVASL